MPGSDKYKQAIAKSVDILRWGSDVRRFHTIPQAGDQSVGHHTMNMVGLLYIVYHPALPPPELIRAVLVHDLPEYYIGDIPADAKHRLPSNSLRYAENCALDGTIWEDPSVGINYIEAMIAKFCDILELVQYLDGRSALQGFHIRVRTMHETARNYLRSHMKGMLAEPAFQRGGRWRAQYEMMETLAEQALLEDKHVD